MKDEFAEIQNILNYKQDEVRKIGFFVRKAYKNKFTEDVR